MLWVLGMTFGPAMLAAADAPIASLIRGPYVQMTTKTTAILRWRTDDPAPSEVRFGQELGDLDREVSDSDLSVDHRVQLANLRPGTRY